MITGLLMEHREFTQDTFKQEVIRLISPFNTLENIEAEGSGSDMLQYLLSEYGDLDMLRKLDELESDALVLKMFGHERERQERSISCENLKSIVDALEAIQKEDGTFVSEISFSE